MEIKVLGAHNLVSSTTSPVTLLVDNKLALDAGSLASGLSLEEQKSIKAILLTHYHYDHMRDIPAIGLSTAYSSSPIEICSSQEVLETLAGNLINGKLYPDFTRWPPESPAMHFQIMVPNKFHSIDDYDVMPLPVTHNVPAMGYFVRDRQGRSLFYTGDTSTGLSDCWKTIAPNLLIIEVSGPNSMEQRMAESGHLTPNGLKKELLVFQKLRGYLPDVLAIHFIPMMEEQIKAELSELGRELKITIFPASHGMALIV